MVPAGLIPAAAGRVSTATLRYRCVCVCVCVCVFVWGEICSSSKQCLRFRLLRSKQAHLFQILKVCQVSLSYNQVHLISAHLTHCLLLPGGKLHCSDVSCNIFLFHVKQANKQKNLYGNISSTNICVAIFC